MKAQRKIDLDEVQPSEPSVCSPDVAIEVTTKVMPFEIEIYHSDYRDLKRFKDRCAEFLNRTDIVITDKSYASDGINFSFMFTYFKK